MASSAVRWGRVVLGGFLAESGLIAAVIPLRMAGSTEAAITLVAVAGSFLVFAPVAWWLARPLARPILHGALMGGVATAFYLTLTALAQYFVPDTPSAPAIYYVAHALKVAGGAAGGWLAGRAAAASARSTATIG